MKTLAQTNINGQTARQQRAFIVQMKKILLLSRILHAMKYLLRVQALKTLNYEFIIDSLLLRLNYKLRDTELTIKFETLCICPCFYILLYVCIYVCNECCS